MNTLEGPVLGLLAQVLLVAGLAQTSRVDRVGGAAALGYGVLVAVLLVAGLRRSGARALGPANAVTLARAVLVGGVLALAASIGSGPAALFWIVTLTIGALVLDGVDGSVARRTGTSSELGARFDMEIDAFLILVLCVVCVPPFGAWVLAIGLMRYVWVVAGRVLPWMRAPLPPRYSRKVVAATQGIVLVCASSGVFPRWMSLPALVIALAMLCWSFGTDLWWLAASRPRAGRPALEPAVR